MSGSLDLLRARVAFRDRSFLDVLDLAVRFVVVHRRAYLAVTLVTIAPAMVASVALGIVAGWIAGWIAAVVLGFLCQTPFTVLASRLVFQPHVSTREVLRASLRDLVPTLAFRFVWILAVTATGSMLIAPAAFVLATTLYVNEVMLLERASLVDAAKRSYRISMSSAGEAFLGALAVFLLPIGSVVLTEVAGAALLTEILQFRAPEPFWSAGGSVLATMGLFLVIPYAVTARLFVYLNARTRAEGWDIQTRFAALAAAASRDERRDAEAA